MRSYQVTFTGTSPLLMHQDNFEFDDLRKDWTKAHKKESTAGDDRSPAWAWLGCLYHDGTHIAIPCENIMAVLRDAGKSTPTGKGQGSFKAQTQSGIFCTAPYWILDLGNGPVPVAPFFDLQRDPAATFEEYCALAKDHGFSLFAKRARVGTSKHVRVRPRFSPWRCSGILGVTDDTLTTDVLTSILETAGTLKGIGDWRPGGVTPGMFGRFEVQIAKV